MTLSPALRAVLGRRIPPARSAGSANGHLPVSADFAGRTIAALGIRRGDRTDGLSAIMAVIEAGRAAGLDEDTLFAAAQAYGRGVGRIVDAEIELTRQEIATHAPDRRAHALDAFLQSIVPLASQLFDTLHAHRLHQGLTTALSEPLIGERAGGYRAVALIDIVDSTGFLASATRVETERLVDSLSAAATGCVADRQILIAKYLGDGFILIGRDPGELSAAALDAVKLLENSEGAFPARAGLAVGPLTRRAGDYFGLVVNKAQRMASMAAPGTVLAERSPELNLLPEWSRRDRQCVLKGLDGPVACVEIGSASQVPPASLRR